MAGSVDNIFHQPDRITGLHRGDGPGEGCALVEVAGRDSIAAAVALAREGSLRRVFPTIAYTGTEYGDMGTLLGNVEILRRIIEPLGVEISDPMILGSPLWWRAVIGRFNTELSRQYGPWHICVGCHMYLHALRAPLSWETGITRVVGGERLGHRGRIKINQTAPAVEAYRGVLAGFGIELEMPLLEIDDEEAILSLAGDWGEGERQPGCVLSGNYRGPGGVVEYDEERLQAYLDEYLVPATELILNALRKEGKADYMAVVNRVLAMGRDPG